MAITRKHLPVHELGGVAQPAVIRRETFFFVQQDNYDEHAELAIPFYRQMHQALLTLVPNGRSEPVRILDLGCGTGKTSQVFLEAYPHSSIVGIDLFDDMLKHARARLDRYSARLELKQADFRSVPFPGRFDVCVSALSIHHLNPAEKKKLFHRIWQALSSGGTFLMIDWTKFRSERIEEISFADASRHAKAAVPNAVAQAWCDHWKTENIPDAVPDLLTWLREAGFAHAECVIRHYGMSLIVAEKE